MKKLLLLPLLMSAFASAELYKDYAYDTINVIL